MYEVVILPKALKQLAKLSSRYREDVRASLLSLAHSPFLGKKLHGDHWGEYSVRAWPYRIIYTVEKKRLLVTVIAIAHRQGVYKK